jgi:hypothetical protein
MRNKKAGESLWVRMSILTSEYSEERVNVRFSLLHLAAGGSEPWERCSAYARGAHLPRVNENESLRDIT